MKVLAYPKDSNPYQELLYSEVRKLGVRVEYLEAPFGSASAGILLRPIQLLLYRLHGFDVFHLHWLYTFKLPIKSRLTDNLVTRSFFTIYFLFLIVWLKVLRYKTVWTVHNIVPHDKTFISDIAVTRILVKLVDICIVHSRYTIEEMNVEKVFPKRVEVVPIGSFIGRYQNTIDTKDARKTLGIPINNIVVGFAGRIEPYKGVVELIEAFKNAKIKDSTLIIFGPCKDRELQSEIEKQSALSKNIKLYLKFIPDNELQTYINACDAIALPFTKITTSSSVLLAASLSKAVIYSNLGNLKELPKEIGFKINDVYDDLKNTLLKAAKDPETLSIKGQAGYKYCQSISWPSISTRYIEVVKK